jgi:hypothetical protein
LYAQKGIVELCRSSTTDVAAVVVREVEASVLLVDFEEML